MSQLTVVKHDETSELPQAPTADEWWQDSAFLAWHAREAGIGGIFRIGYEPNHAGGLAALWFGLVTRDGTRYRRNTVHPLDAPARRADGFHVLDDSYSISYEGRVRYRVDDEDCRLELEVEDFYPRTDFFPPDAGALVDDCASNHFETSGRITGEVVLDGVRYEVDGLCHRDRSWGVRHFDKVLNHRWVPGTFGPDLSFGSVAWHAVDGTVRQFGYVVRDGEVAHALDVDTVVYMEPDGTTYRGGVVTWTLPGEERLEIACTPLDAVLTEHHGVACVDAFCEVEHDGRIGFCDLEVSTNPRGGSGPITAALRATAVDGLSRRQGP